MGEEDNKNEITDSVGAKNDEEKESEEKKKQEIKEDSTKKDSNDEEAISELRRSERTPKPRKFEDCVMYMCTENTELDSEPITVAEALSRPDAEKWKRAMSEELQSFQENDAWELEDMPKDGAVVESKWVFKRKIDSKNNVQYRARLVAKVFLQRPGIDFDETFSPVVRHSSLRLLFALSVKLNLSITHLDVKTAFLNGYLKERLFMKQPEGFESLDKNRVLRLKRAIYGLKQSSRAWNERLNKILLELGYKRSDLEQCLYVKRRDKVITIIALYVDDFFIFSNCKKETDFVKEKLSSKFKIKDLGEAKQCLGMRINIDKVNQEITLDQENYIDQLLRKFDMLECKPAKTPIESKLNLELDDGKIDVPYQKLIGSLMYLAVLTRPDIAFSVSFLSQFNNSHTETHWKYAKRILRYLQATKNYGLKFKKEDTDLEGFVDADWASNSVDRKSYTGYGFKFSGSLVSWESVKQKTVALSSTESEYMAIAEACKEAIYLRNLLQELTGNLHCIKLFNDNQSAQKLSVNHMYHKRSKHIDVRHHFIREAISNKWVKVEYLPTADMPADIFTKGLSSEKHYKFLNGLGIGIL
jgi:hypothetical protein